MKMSGLLSAIALATLLPSAAQAQQDCHQDMKDLLQGTLDMAKQADVRQVGDSGSSNCTLASGQGGSSPLEAIAKGRSQPILFVPRA